MTILISLVKYFHSLYMLAIEYKSILISHNEHIDNLIGSTVLKQSIGLRYSRVNTRDV
jgi:hypothetical protein